MNTVINSFVENAKEILQDNLAGVYLRGSAVMGCYNPAKSDILLLIMKGEHYYGGIFEIKKYLIA